MIESTSNTCFWRQSIINKKNNDQKHIHSTKMYSIWTLVSAFTVSLQVWLLFYLQKILVSNCMDFLPVYYLVILCKHDLALHWRITFLELCQRPIDCQDVLWSGRNSSGVYTIYPQGTGGLKVYCDMTTAGGGWTV